MRNEPQQPQPKILLKTQMCKDLKHASLAAIAIAIAIAIALIVLGAFLYRPHRDDESKFKQVLSSREDLPKRFDDQAFVSLTRTACYGTCPVYTVKIFGSGLVEFRGEWYVCAEGPVLTQIPHESAQRLLNAMVASGFNNLPDFTREDITCLSSATVMLSLGAYSHSVEHYHGMRPVPGVIRAIEKEIDARANTSQWLPIDGDDGLFCHSPDGTRHAPLQ